LAAELRSRPPVFLAHGDADEMIPFESLAAAVEALGGLDVAVRWHVARGVGHGIDPESLALGGDFLAEALGG
jgi:phospholipase/carboxylesterase